ncbi:protein zer-1 homolog isoform X1 [Dermacentor albipictus]|uniref:protein zer-1 homolog isoform X1 n=1 Tax=Dermacentor albipictus TaxID=60249 RepID=UPI0031FC2A36
MEPRFAGFPTVWEPYTADRLVDLAGRQCLQQLSQLMAVGPELRLPAPLCERLLKLAGDDDYPGCTSAWCSLIELLVMAPDRTRLERLRVPPKRPLSDDELAALAVMHPVRELDLGKCAGLTPQVLPLLAQGLAISTGTLQSLTMPPHLLQQDAGWTGLSWLWSQTSLERLSLSRAGPQLSANAHWNLLRSLRQLDLSHCSIPHGENLAGLEALAPTLAWLSLADVPKLHLGLEVLCQLKALRHLDLSQSTNKQGQGFYPQPNSWLSMLAESLPELTSLDLSGTNLPGKEPTYDQHETPGTGMRSSIAGLQCRVEHPLDFLGLLNTPCDACYRSSIPALRVSGDATEEQVLVSAQAYQSRPLMLQKVLNDLFHVFRYEACDHPRLALDVVLSSMARHPNDKHIQIAGSASLFYLVKGEERANFNVSIRRKIIKCLLDAMGYHRSDTTMLRNGCLTMIHFKIPQDVLFDYERLVDMLLFIVSQYDQDEFVQRIGIYLLNSLACQVDGCQKRLVGDKGAIAIMLQLIDGRLRTHTSDEVMETAWSTMWNVTDETPINCERFLDGGGMTLFLECLRIFTDKPELLRNMMGLLGNVAEVRELRPRLMHDEYLLVFSELLDSESDGIEVSYNAAGILAHILSDGAESWDQAAIQAVSRGQVLVRMRRAIDRWALVTKRNINYRSFEPILRLLQCEHTPEAQHWAVWALANLTQVYPGKYCPLVREEGGLEMLERLMRNPRPYPRIHELAKLIIDQCVNGVYQVEWCFKTGKWAWVNLIQQPD